MAATDKPVVELDTGEAQKAAAALSGALAGLGKAARQIGTSFAKSLSSALDSMGKAQTGAGLMAGALTGAAAGAGALSDKMKTTAKTAGTAAKRTLASFDQIERLGSPASSSGGSKSSGKTTGSTTEAKEIQALIAALDRLVARWDAEKEASANAWAWIVETWSGACAWFDETILQPLSRAFSGLWEGLCGPAGNAWQGILNIFSPIVAWFGALLGSLSQTWSDVFFDIGVIATGGWEIVQAAWGIVATWFDEHVIQPVSQFFTDLWSGIGQGVTAAWEGIQSLLGGVGTWIYQTLIQPVTQFFTNLWSGIGQGVTAAWGGVQGLLGGVGTWVYQTLIQPVAQFFSGLWEGFLAGARQAWAGVQSVFSAVAGFFGKIFSEAWAAVVKVFSVAGDIFVDIRDGIVSVFKTVVNGLIRGINSVVAVPFQAINSALRAIRDINILGLTPFQNLRTISVPQIPYLAQGAVLPANRPFLAMVGDQRHGTNVEAPLSTIQEAVALALADREDRDRANQAAMLGVLREILEAVLGIQVGDEVIGRAAQRYDRKMAVMRGGF